MDKGNKGLLTMIGEGAVFEGTAKVPHSFRIDGTFKGKLEIGEALFIGNTGVVEADIEAKSVIIGGKVKGNLMVEERIELESGSSLYGDLKTKDLVINDGAVFHGNSSMEKSKKANV
ncbi:polymer-forming cytoskeletal protein [Chitinispirillales bacterium ANBcel5]|uniref:bactofilin family protein n=1 Tax=Cellulosispirillum alkaliphilum TaxID=3039283 RepID=UPI002A51EBE3|nr:polymer-forming cytoskeletal protein [Chitinispirillales bacterium ANBcel5]